MYFQPKNHEYQTNRAIRPLNTVNWAKKQDKIFDVFLFLGTSKMDLRGIRQTKANYEAFSNSKIKYVFIVYLVFFFFLTTYCLRFR